MTPTTITKYVSPQGTLTTQGVELFLEVERRMAAAESKLAAIAAVTAPAGGATTDAEARTAINSILTAAG